VILPNQNLKLLIVEWNHGIGNSKNPSFQLSEKCIGVRLGGMGVAGSLIGTE
jgi:hypothetical protein